MTCYIGSQFRKGRTRRRGYKAFAGVPHVFDLNLAASEVRVFAFSLDPDDLESLFIETPGRVRLVNGTAGTNEIQEISTTGSPSSGSLTITHTTFSSAYAVPYDCTSATLQTALDARATPGSFIASGGPWPGTALRIEWTGGYAATPYADLTYVISTLSPGAPAGPTTIQNGAAGSTVDSIDINPGTGLIWYAGRGDDCPLTTAFTSLTLTNLQADRNTRVRIRATVNP